MSKKELNAEELTSADTSTPGTVLPAENEPEIFIVPEELDSERFDAVIASLSEGHSRSYLKTLIKEGSVLLNGKTETRYRLFFPAI